jgi:sigma-B regulation protein RsbU (phosphoserine phosphatase)
MSNRSLAYRLGLFISLAVLLVFAIFVFLLLRFHISSTRKSNENKAVLLSSDIYRNVRDVVVKTNAVSSDIARQTEFYLDYDGMDIFLSGIVKEYDFLQSVEIKLNKTGTGLTDLFFVATTKNDKVLFYKGNNPDGFCIPENTLKNYLPNSDLSKEGWSEPFFCKNYGTNISVYYYPFEIKDDSGEIQTSGSVKCIISLTKLMEMINKTRISTKIWKNGYAFLASHNGVYMTYPMQQYVLKRNIYTVYYNEKKKNSSDLVKFMNGEYVPLVVYPPVLNYKKGWSFPTVIEENKWLVVFTVPFSELHQNIFDLMIKMSSIILVLVIAIFFLVFSIASKVMEPLTKISNELHSFSIEFLGLNPESNNETVALRKSLERLQERYERHKKSEAEIALRGSKFLSDLALASEIQQSIIPQTGNYFLQNSGIAIHTVFRPAQYVSGDLYDFFMIDNKRLVITMGDVSGGGIPAALFMGVAHTYIRSNALYDTSKEIASQVNKQLCKNNSNQFFLTLFLGILDISNGILNYCSAGHTPTILYSANGKIQELNNQHGLPLGLYPEKEYSDTSITINKGDYLVLYTDGVTEHINEAGEFFGAGSFYSLLKQLKDNSPEEISTMIMQSVDRFGSGAAQHNDLSLMVVKYN